MKKHCFVVLAYKESPYLEECIKSVKNQKYKSDIIIATSTPNKFISEMAKKYKLKVVQKDSSTGIGGDFDFAISVGTCELVTIAHQDDIYDYEYSDKVVKKYEKNPNSIILFTDYYEIKGKNKVYKTPNLIIKRFLLFPLRNDSLNNLKIFKRFSIAFGNSICCPAVTFVKKQINLPLFDYPFKCDIDWHAWEILSKKKKNFSFINKSLMGHRVHDGSTTTEIIKENIRTKEDLEMFKRFWPNFFAKILNKLYINSEKSNNVKE